MGVPPGEQVRDWGRDQPGYAGAEYGGYRNEQYQGAEQQYPAGGYDQQSYDPYQAGQYDPYAYDGQAQQAPYEQGYGYDQGYGNQGYDPAYDPAQQAEHPHGTGSERPDGSQQ